MVESLLELSELSRAAVVECCEYCDRPLLDGAVFSDPDTCYAGLGTSLCSRQRCIADREAMPLQARLNVYLGLSGR